MLKIKIQRISHSSNPPSPLTILLITIAAIFLFFFLLVIVIYALLPFLQNRRRARQHQKRLKEDIELQASRAPPTTARKSCDPGCVGFVTASTFAGLSAGSASESVGSLMSFSSSLGRKASVDTLDGMDIPEGPRVLDVDHINEKIAHVEGDMGNAEDAGGCFVVSDEKEDGDGRVFTEISEANTVQEMTYGRSEVTKVESEEERIWSTEVVEPSEAF